VLGANDGLVSTAALMMGVGGGTSNLATLRLAGVAGMVGGSLSMAVSRAQGWPWSWAAADCSQAYKFGRTGFVAPPHASPLF
jgi:hypothetical protein